MGGGRDFLGNRLIAPGTSAWQSFARPLQSLGVRFVFPPSEGDASTQQVRIETWPQDQRSIWIENSSTYTGPLAAGELTRLADQLTATYRHVTGPVCDFLASLDTP